MLANARAMLRWRPPNAYAARLYRAPFVPALQTMPRRCTDLPYNLIQYASTLALPTEDSEPLPRNAAEDSEIPAGCSVGHLYFDSVYPIAFGSLDPRAYLVKIQGDAPLQQLRKAIAEQDKIGFDFKVLGVESRAKDGGAFLTFAYRPDAAASQEDTSIQRRIPPSTSLTPDESATLTLLNSRIRPLLRPFHQSFLSPARFLPASLLPAPRAHIVLGTPWLEDLARYPARTIKISFLEGGSPTEQQVWEMLRPYGRVYKLQIDTKANEATAVYTRMRGATSARNCLYGASIAGRKVVIDYLPPLHTHKMYDWATSHPRIMLPFLAFFLGSITYAIFDPVRGWFIKHNVENTFDLDAYPLYNWLRKKTVGLFRTGGNDGRDAAQDDWWERKAAADEIRSWLRESPSTFITISGPRGSGKHQLLQRAITSTSIKHLTINCDEIAHSYKNQEAALVPAVAKEVGYFPVFNWINSLNSMIDLASVGLIGSKAGFSTPTDAQLKQVLSVTTAALVSIKEDTKKEKELKAKRAAKTGAASPAAPSSSPAKEFNRVAAGNQTGEKASMPASRSQDELGEDAKLLSPAMNSNDAEEKGYDAPVVVINAFHHKGVKSDLLWTVLGDWAAELTTGQVAHVVFVTDNPVGMGKTLSRSLPNVPFESIVLADADQDRARGYVSSKLKELGSVSAKQGSTQQQSPPPGQQSALASLLSRRSAEPASQSNDETGLTSDMAHWVDLLGGRLTDLENLVQKVSLGQTVENAVQDIIARTVVEIRKNAFGDDLEDAKNLPWSRSQAWTVVEQLADKGEIPYYALLHDSFKGDESAIKALEQAEIISVRHLESRPSTIRAGRPVIQQALQSLVADRVFADTQRFLSNGASIASCEKVIREVEAELQQLSESAHSAGNVIKSSAATKSRLEYLMDKLGANQDKIVKLEKKNATLMEEMSRETSAL